MNALANMHGYFGHWATPLTVAGFTIGGMMFAVLILWSIYWKGLALWLAARHNNLKWFIALLLINTVGILEILYIYVFSKKKTENKQ